MDEEIKRKVYLETSFVSYLTGRATTREPTASWQSASRQWWGLKCPVIITPKRYMEDANHDA